MMFDDPAAADEFLLVSPEASVGQYDGFDVLDT
jgi:hypothetical protein